MKSWPSSGGGACPRRGATGSAALSATVGLPRFSTGPRTSRGAVHRTRQPAPQPPCFQVGQPVQGYPVRALKSIILRSPARTGMSIPYVDDQSCKSNKLGDSPILSSIKTVIQIKSSSPYAATHSSPFVAILLQMLHHIVDKSTTMTFP